MTKWLGRIARTNGSLGDGAAPIAYCHLEIVRLPTRRRPLRGRRLKERLVG